MSSFWAGSLTTSKSYKGCALWLKMVGVEDRAGTLTGLVLAPVGKFPDVVAFGGLDLHFVPLLSPEGLEVRTKGLSISLKLEPLFFGHKNSIWRMNGCINWCINCWEYQLLWCINRCGVSTVYQLIKTSLNSGGSTS